MVKQDDLNCAKATASVAISLGQYNKVFYNKMQLTLTVIRQMQVSDLNTGHSWYTGYYTCTFHIKLIIV